MRGDVCEALQVLLRAELVEPRLGRPGNPLDRTEGNVQPLSQSVAAQEPESSRQDTDTCDEHEAEKEDGCESESCQYSGQQEPHPGERENAAAQLLSID
jgi:hypothetical protein